MHILYVVQLSVIIVSFFVVLCTLIFSIYVLRQQTMVVFLLILWQYKH